MIEIDCMGLPCPQPIIALAKAIRNLEAKSTVILISNDPATEVDLKAWSRMTGNDVAFLEGNRYQITKS